MANEIDPKSEVPQFRPPNRRAPAAEQPEPNPTADDQQSGVTGVSDSTVAAAFPAEAIPQPAKVAVPAAVSSQIAFSFEGVPRAPMVAGVFALVTAFGTTQTWVRALFIGINGTDTDRGLVTVLAALGLAGLSAWRVFFGLRDRNYVIAGILLAVLAFSMPLWMLLDVANEPADEFFGSRVITAAGGLYLTLFAATGMIASMAWHTLKQLSRHREEHTGD